MRMIQLLADSRFALKAVEEDRVGFHVGVGNLQGHHPVVAHIHGAKNRCHAAARHRSLNAVGSICEPVSMLSRKPIVGHYSVGVLSSYSTGSMLPDSQGFHKTFPDALIEDFTKAACMAGRDTFPPAPLSAPESPAPWCCRRRQSPPRAPPAPAQSRQCSFCCETISAIVWPGHLVMQAVGA